jgi:hypothetical protein
MNIGIDECPINDDYKQREFDLLPIVEKLEMIRRNKIEERATEIYLEEYESTGSVDFAKYMYFRHLHLYL